MIEIPEEFTKEQKEIIPIELIQDKYFTYYRKRIPASAVNIINQISIIADLTKGSDNDVRYNSILFVKIELSSLPQRNNLKKALFEIEKAIFRSFPYQCFLIFNFQENVMYCTSIFRAYKNNQRNNKVEDAVFSAWVSNKDSSEKNARMEDSINNLLMSADNARGIYNQIYQKIYDNHLFVMEWKHDDWIEKVYGSETVSKKSGRENDTSESTPITNSPETEKKLKEYAELQKKAQNDPTGESQYKFAKEHYYGTLHRNLITYRDFLIKAAQKGYPTAIEELAPLYETGMKDDREQPLINKDLEKALALYKKANNSKKRLDIMQKMNAKH